MGLDAVKNTRIQKRVGRRLTTTNLYHKLLVKLFKFLARRTDTGFNKTVLRRLNHTGVNRYPVSLSRLVRYQQNVQDKNRPLVVVANVTNDARLLTVPKLTVVALRVTETARKRVLAAGGQVHTLDQFVQKNPTGSGALLVRGPRSREELKHFGRAPGLPGSHTKPYVRAKGRKFEKARGKR